MPLKPLTESINIKKWLLNKGYFDIWRKSSSLRQFEGSRRAVCAMLYRMTIGAQSLQIIKRTIFPIPISVMYNQRRWIVKAATLTNDFSKSSVCGRVTSYNVVGGIHRLVKENRTFSRAEPAFFALELISTRNDFPAHHAGSSLVTRKTAINLFVFVKFVCSEFLATCWTSLFDYPVFVSAFSGTINSVYTAASIVALKLCTANLASIHEDYPFAGFACRGCGQAAKQAGHAVHEAASVHGLIIAQNGGF